MILVYVPAYHLSFSEFNRTTEQLRYILFVKATDPKQEKWNDPAIGVSAAVAYFKADEVIIQLL